MKRFVLVCFALAVFATTSISAQSATANKAWVPFWNKFAAAVRTKKRDVIRGLAYSKFRSFAPFWLQSLEQNNLWSNFQDSINGGTNPYDRTGGHPWRFTKDNQYYFVFERGHWTFGGAYGD